MRSRLIVRHKRRCIYLSNLIVCIAAGFALCAAYLLPHTALSMLLPGEYEAAATVLAYTALSFALAAYDGIILLTATGRCALSRRRDLK